MATHILNKISIDSPSNSQLLITIVSKVEDIANFQAKATLCHDFV